MTGIFREWGAVVGGEVIACEDRREAARLAFGDGRVVCRTVTYGPWQDESDLHGGAQ